MNITRTVARATLIGALLAGSALSAPAFAQDKIAGAGDIVVRLRGISIIPNESASTSVIGGDVDISNEPVPEIDFSYFVTDAIAVELIAGSARHHVVASDTALGNIDLGFVRHVPPTLTLQYHQQGLGPVKPYLGAGINYTFFTEQDAEGFNVDYDNSFGWAVQIGSDFKINDRWFANFDLKYIAIQTDVDISTNLTPGDASSRVDLTSDVKINPLVLGFGIGTRF